MGNNCAQKQNIQYVQKLHAPTCTSQIVCVPLRPDYTTPRGWVAILHHVRGKLFNTYLKGKDNAPNFYNNFHNAKSLCSNCVVCRAHWEVKSLPAFLYFVLCPISNTIWSIGKDIAEKQYNNTYGSGFFKQLSQDLRTAIPDAKGFSVNNLRYMHAFYLLYSQRIEKPPQAAGILEEANCLHGVDNSTTINLLQDVEVFENRPQGADNSTTENLLRGVEDFTQQNTFIRHNSINSNFCGQME